MSERVGKVRTGKWLLDLVVKGVGGSVTLGRVVLFVDGGACCGKGTAWGQGVNGKR